tara:strand:- start:349 stop:765 length:417 start_codon:yes stop_codon:yes gene_type:complete
MREVFKLFEDWRRYNQDQYSVGSDPFYGPPPLINDVIDCWANDGIRFYNEFHHANGMAYHVMLPTNELEFHIDRDVSKNDYSFLAQQMIQNGAPMNAVRIDVGKNGRAIIDRDVEIVMAAKQVGLELLPVSFYFHEEV